MEQIISKEEVNKLINLKGEVKGFSIRQIVEFLLKEEGEEGLKKLENVMVSIGYPLEYKKIKRTGLYPMYLGAIMLLAIKRLFNWDDKKFQEMGRDTSKLPFLIRSLFSVAIFKPQLLIKEIPRIWRKNNTVGDFEVTEFNEAGRYIIFKLKNYPFPSVSCQTIIGLLSGISKIMIKKDVVCEETKCIHEGDSYHEFLVKW